MKPTKLFHKKEYDSLHDDWKGVAIMVGSLLLFALIVIVAIFI